jgi:hypothetical protein
MKGPEAVVLGFIAEGGAPALHDCEAQGLTESAFPSADAATVWRMAKRLDGERTDWPGDELLDAVNESRPELVDALLEGQGRVGCGALVPRHVGKLLKRAWKRDVLAAADALRGAVKSGGDATEAWCRLSSVFSSGARVARVHWMTAGEILDAELPPESWLVHPWLSPGQVSALVGAPGTGKTRFVVWSLAAMMARHPAIGSMRIPEREGGGKWLIVAGNENGLRRVQEDLRAVGAAFPEAVEEIRRRLVFHVFQDGDLPMDAAALVWVENKLRELGEECEGVTFDPLSDFLPAAQSLNEDAAMKGLVVRLRNMVRRAAPKAAVLLVHHARGGRDAMLRAVDAFESGEAGRNSKMLGATCRCVLNLVPYDDAGGVVGAVGKCNDARRPPPFALRLENGVYVRDPDFALERWKEEVREGKKRAGAASVSDGGRGEDVARLIQPGERVSAGTLEARAEGAGIPRATYYRHRKAAVDAGFIVEDECGWMLGDELP